MDEGGQNAGKRVSERGSLIARALQLVEIEIVV